MKLVKFDNGSYGLRRFSWFEFRYVYLDIKHYQEYGNVYWFPKGKLDISNASLLSLENVQKSKTILPLK